MLYEDYMFLSTTLLKLYGAINGHQSSVSEENYVPNHLPLSANLKIMILSSQTLEFVTKDNILQFWPEQTI